MQSSRRLHFDCDIRDDLATLREPEFPVATAKLIEYLKTESILAIAAILGTRFFDLVNEIEVGDPR